MSNLPHPVGLSLSKLSLPSSAPVNRKGRASTGSARTLLGVGACILLGSAALSQTIADERRALTEAKAQASAAGERSKQLEARAKRERDEAAQARAREAAVAAGIQAAEAGIDAAQARLAIVETMRRDQRARLAARQGPIVRLTAALQTLARRPPALAIVQPGSVADLVHVRATLAGILPVVEARTEGLRAEVERGRRLGAMAEQALAGIEASRGRLEAERLSLARLEADHRRRSSALARTAALEGERAIALGEEARDIADLMTRLGDQADTRDALIGLPGPLPRPARPGQAATPPRDRAQPERARLPYRLPAIGEVVTGLGELSESGVRSAGLTIATRAGAQIVAPSGGRIAFAGPYRGYGGIAIIDHGDGLTSLITSLDSLSVRVGDIVDQGSPIGRAGPGRPTITVELRRGGTPIDISRLVS